MYIIFNFLPSRYNDVIIYCKRPILNDLGTELRSKMAARFRAPKSEDEERLLLSKVVPKNTTYNTKWCLKVFTEWQQRRQNKIAKLETCAWDGFEMTNVEDLTVPLEEMSAKTLNFWLSKFIGEVAKQNGERYPPKSVHLLVCGINRQLSEAKGEEAVNVLDKSDRR